MKLSNRLSEYLLANPAAWLLAVLLLIVVYRNYELGSQLETVCDAIPYPTGVLAEPKTALEKAQNICADRQNGDDTPEEN